MKIINKHTAPITLPAKSRKEAGVRLEPGQTGEADGALALIKAWLSAGLIADAAPPAPPVVEEASPVDEKRSRKS